MAIDERDDQAGDPAWLSEARYRAIAEDQPDIVARFLPDGTLTYVNDAYCRFFGVQREDVLGRPYQPTVHPDDLETVQAQVARLSPDNPVVFIENRVYRGDGEARWTEWSNRALYDAQGNLLELQAAGRDVTERRAAAEAAARLAAIVSSADVAIYSTSLDGAITSWNRAAERMFGYAASEAIGRPIGIIITGRGTGPHEGERVLERLQRGETVEHLETEKVRKDGTRVPVALTLSPIAGPDGRVIGISRIARDITERVRIQREVQAAFRRETEAREAAEQANRLKDEFLAIVSHELRTPLNAILGWTRLLRDGTVAGDSVPTVLETIERNARIQAQLVGDLLDVSRMISGKLPLRIEPTELAPVIHAAVQAVHPTAAAKQIDLQVHVTDPETIVTGDADRLQQAIGNLLVNAVKFTPEGGAVHVTVRRADDVAIVTVRDTGVGISADALPFIFDRFRQADSRTTRAHGGLGLGLAIVQYVAQALGGSVHADSDGPGMGTTFALTLPLAGAGVPPQAGAPAVERADLRGLRVLVVDDEPDARHLMRTMLEACGAEVTTAGSAVEALEAAGSDCPDLLVGDIGMADRDGYDLIRDLRARPDCRELKALAVTAYASPDHRDAALEAGYDAHLSKPVDPDALSGEIAALLADRRHG